uniref:Uncharacterized protein n=1 Tax=Anguilla anguilla TaxID=7936 RepID=A0A0E9QZY5_ANGAN
MAAIGLAGFLLTCGRRAATRDVGCSGGVPCSHASIFAVDLA